MTSPRTNGMRIFLSCLRPQGSADAISDVDHGTNIHEETEALTEGLRETKKCSVPVYSEVSRRQCCLLEDVWERRWPYVLERCKSHPSEACCISDLSRRTALHLASFNHGCPVFVAEALIQANPHALSREDHYGHTPLHCVSFFQGGTDNLVILFCEKLVEFHSLGTDTSLDKRAASVKRAASPLHMACARDAPIQVLDALVSMRSTDSLQWVAPVTGGEPYWESDTRIKEETPLNVLVNNRREDLVKTNCAAKQRMRSVTYDFFQWNQESDELTHCGQSSDDDHTDTLSTWLKCLLLLREHMHRYSHIDGNDQGSLVHLVASLNVPIPALVECCAQLFPDEVLNKDDRGYTPLHHSLLHSATEVMHILLHHEPKAAKVVLPNGQLPLIVALEKNLSWNDGLNKLVSAFPDSLIRRDPLSRLYPSLLAASLDAELGTIFLLIRLRPDLLKHCL